MNEEDEDYVIINIMDSEDEDSVIIKEEDEDSVMEAFAYSSTSLDQTGNRQARSQLPAENEN